MGKTWVVALRVLTATHLLSLLKHTSWTCREKMMKEQIALPEELGSWRLAVSKYCLLHRHHNDITWHHHDITMTSHIFSTLHVFLPLHWWHLCRGCRDGVLQPRRRAKDGGALGTRGNCDLLCWLRGAGCHCVCVCACHVILYKQSFFLKNHPHRTMPAVLG